MRVYLDTSAALKRVLEEPESAALTNYLVKAHERGWPLVSSSLAWIETARALRRALPDDPVRTEELTAVALSGAAERPLVGEVPSLARRIGPAELRSLDAVHLATALAVDADVVLTYDVRLAAAASSHGLRALAPA